VVKGEQITRNGINHYPTRLQVPIAILDRFLKSNGVCNPEVTLPGFDRPLLDPQFAPLIK
jgi:hypothetical protein